VRAPVVTDDARTLCADVVEQAGDVAAELDDVVGVRIGWRARAAVAAHVRREYVVPRAGQRFDLVAPRVPELREPVDQDDRLPLPRLRDVQLDAVRADLAVADASRVRHAG